MAGDNLRIQNQIVPLAEKIGDRKADKTRRQKTFEIGEKPFVYAGRKDFSKNRADDFRPDLTEENWLRERTIEELKTLVKAIQLGATDPWQLTDLIFYSRH